MLKEGFPINGTEGLPINGTEGFPINGTEGLSRENIGFIGILFIDQIPVRE